MKTKVLAIASALCVLAVVVGAGWYTVFRPRPVLRVSADFMFADGIFPGNRMMILGVPVGTVESVRPQGATVRITMALPPDTKIPRDAQAFIMSPAVISDRYVEFGPAYTGGAVLDDNAVIPVQRTHAPIKWDQLTQSLDSLVTALGPPRASQQGTSQQGAGQQGGLGALVHSGAAMAAGTGPQIRDAITNVAQATDLLASGTGDVDAVLDNLDKLVQLLVQHKSTIDTLVQSTTQATTDLTAEQATLSDTISQLSTALTAINDLLRNHGNQLTGDVTQLASLSNVLVQHQQQLAETLDTMPLAMDNIDRTITPDQRMRLRLDFSTNLTQFDRTRQLCQRFTIPLCEGAGLTNPIPFPPTLPDALGLNPAMNGGGR